MNEAWRGLLKWSRTLHIYVSMFALLALLFFAATGFMLNHADWFGFDQATTSSTEAEVPVELLGDPLDKLALVEHLRAEHGATGRVQPFDPHAEDTEIDVVFESPGHKVEYHITRETGATRIDTESFGINGRMTDLHRGKNTGDAWPFVIDAVSLLLIFITLTGLVLWLSLKKRLAIGAIAAAVSAAALGALYLWTVP